MKPTVLRGLGCCQRAGSLEEGLSLCPGTGTTFISLPVSRGHVLKDKHLFRDVATLLGFPFLLHLGLRLERTQFGQLMLTERRCRVSPF